MRLGCCATGRRAIAVAVPGGVCASRFGAALHKLARLAAWRHLLGPVVMGVAITVSAQAHPEALPPSAPDAVTLDATLVKTGLYLITGGGANSLLRFSANGLILVDAKSPGTYRALKSQVRRIAKISDLPVRVLVVTDHHATHAGNAKEFMASGATIIAHENAEIYLRMLHTAATPLPIITYEREYTLRLGSVEVRVMHLGRAQTNDAAVVLFPDLRVIAVGDLFTQGAPQPDFAGGGSLAEWSLVLEAVLKLEFDLVVPSTGPMATRAELQAFKARLDALLSRATALVRGGVAKEHLVAQLAAGDLGWRFGAEQLDGLYDELARQR